MSKNKSDPVTIHFNDGSVQSGLLHSDLLSGRAVRFQKHTSSRDRRGEDRVFVIKEVRVDQGRIQRTTDLSGRGMFIDTLTVYGVDTILPVELILGDQKIRLDARVAFHEPGIGMGLEFHHLPSGVRLKLEGIIEQERQEVKRVELNDRRSWKERRTKLEGEGQGKTKIFRGIRSRDRRHEPEDVGEPVDIRFSDIKAIFFRKSFEMSGEGGEEGIIEFRDGESLKGRFFDPSPESGGIFVEIRLAPDLYYRMFVVKSAIKSLEYL